MQTNNKSFGFTVKEIKPMEKATITQIFLTNISENEFGKKTGII